MEDKIKGMYDKINTKEKHTNLLNSGMFWEFHPELTGDWEVDQLTILAENLNQVPRDLDVKKALTLAGKLAVMARLVTNANAKSLSQRIKEMELALDAYDNEIYSLIR